MHAAEYDCDSGETECRNKEDEVRTSVVGQLQGERQQSQTPLSVSAI